MMQSEFTKMTGMYVTASHYAEIEKRYMESGLSKQDFCKAYKANKDGIAEAIAQEASMTEWRENNEAEKEWKEKLAEVERRMELNREISKTNYQKVVNENEELKAKLEMLEKNANTITDWWGAEKERANKAEEELKAKDQEIMMLKAKLYDMMMKGVA